MQKQGTMSPTKKKTLLDDTVSQLSVAPSQLSPTKRQQRGLTKKLSSEYESQGLTANAVEGLNMKALGMELKRERAMNQSLQRDIEMLRQ